MIISFYSNKNTVKHNYKFIGESEHWEGEYVFKGTERWKEKNKRNTFSSESTYRLTIKYKGTLDGLSLEKKRIPVRISIVLGLALVGSSHF